jgi:hypothetical protein
MTCCHAACGLRGLAAHLVLVAAATGSNVPHNRARERHSGNDKKLASRAPVDAIVRPLRFRSSLSLRQ